MDRVKRHALILDLLRSGGASNQEMLVDALASRGVRTTQATLSRDLRELGVLKGRDGYTLPGALSGGSQGAFGVGGAALGRAGDGLARALRGHLLSALPGVGLVVCKTAPGHAQVIALELDRTPPEGVIGTVGGDDTVFVAVDSAERALPLTEELLELAGLDAAAVLGAVLREAVGSGAVGGGAVGQAAGGVR
ncbi:MAG: arginine repressor [Planctomycetota bacterium]